MLDCGAPTGCGSADVRRFALSFPTKKSTPPFSVRKIFILLHSFHFHRSNWSKIGGGIPQLGKVVVM
jgi:hypothetical protein